MNTDVQHQNIPREVAAAAADDDDDEQSEGELSSDSDNDEMLSQSTNQIPQTGQSWTNMLTERNLSSIMSNAFADNSQIIHIDDPIAQQSANPLTYVFPPGTNVEEYFERKQKQTESKPKRKPTRRDLKNLSHLLNKERNEDLLRAILDIIGCRRAFQYAHEAIRLHKTNDPSIIKSDNGQTRTLGGTYFKMFLSDNDNHLITPSERDEIKKRNQICSYPMCIAKYLIVYFIFSFCNLSNQEGNFNPYETLGVSRTASDKDIRQVYKKLAKHWHPDKNSEPNAHDQFTKINAAYEILSDPKKRQDYDQFGTTSEGNQQRGFNPHDFHDPFDMFRAHFFHETSSNARKIIHAYEFLTDILPNSYTKPYVIFGSTNFCFHCRRPAEVFRSMEPQFNDVGIGTAEFNIHEQRLSNELGVMNVPSLCVISQGQVYHFEDQDYSEQNIKQFVRNAIPIHRFVRNLQTYDDITKMLMSYNQSNRVSAILITKQKIPSLKFVLPCLQYQTRIECATFNSAVIKSNLLPSYLISISRTSDTILLFKEDTTRPEVVIKDSDFSFDNIKKTLESNQLLHLPSITSANAFNLVCPIGSARPCFLILGNRNLFQQHYSTFLQLSKRLFGEQKSQLAYLDRSLNTQVFASYVRERNLRILAIRRWSVQSIEIQDTNIDINEKPVDIVDISTQLETFFSHRWSNSKKHSVPNFVDLDQRNENLFIKLYDSFGKRWNYWVERNGLFRYLLSYLFTYQFWIITILVLIYIYYLRDEPEIDQKKSHKIKQIQVHEFNETFLQRCRNPGAANSIILLLIADTPADECVKHFKEQTRLIKDSRMVYSILYRQRSRQWLNELSKNILDKQSSQFLPATVLALYIRRNFFVSYGQLDADCNNSNESCEHSSSKLTFSDWIDLLLNGTFRQLINVTDWPTKFS
ncbi:unnamed protein product [Adineta ricciae]|uniref:J domain-containing protein n=2 Tax=Adineta ricciae TaxID=249248 RepID=A0A816CS00_ADIRI|nr:unnamed protein product [Adineta ricciae]